MPTVIKIECFEDNRTEFDYPNSAIKGHFSETEIREQARKLISKSHYNEIFSIQVVENHNKQAADLVAATFKKELESQIKKNPDLNLAIQGRQPENWAARKASIDQDQLAILKAVFIVSEKIRAYPKMLDMRSLQEKVQKTSAKDLLEAKSFVDAHGKNGIHEKKAVPPKALKLLFFCIGAGLIIAAGALVPPLLFLGIPLVIVSAIPFVLPYIDVSRFNSKTGLTAILKETPKLSDDFLKTLEPGPARTAPTPSSSPLETSQASTQPNLITQKKEEAPSTKLPLGTAVKPR